MIKCSNCGHDCEEKSFCPNCGFYNKRQKDVIVHTDCAFFDVNNLKIKRIASFTEYLAKRKKKLTIAAIVGAVLLTLGIVLMILGFTLKYDDSSETDWQLFTVNSAAICLVASVWIALVFFMKLKLYRVLTTKETPYAVIFGSINEPLTVVFGGAVYKVFPDSSCPLCGAEVYFDKDADKRVVLVCDKDRGADTHFFYLDSVALKSLLAANKGGSDAGNN